MIEVFNKNKKMIAIITAVMLVLSTVIVMEMTRPSAVFADGTKVKDPSVLVANGEEICVVEDDETAAVVMEKVLNEYKVEGAQVNSVILDKDINIKTKRVKRTEEAPIVLTEEEAVDSILKKNESEKPVFQATMNLDVTSLDEEAFITEYEENDQMYEGEVKVKEAGVNGNKLNTNEAITVNGKLVSSEVKDQTTINGAKAAIQYKGTKEKAEVATASAKKGAAYAGEVVGSGDGASIAAFALQFIGNPYKYGGTSLTNGADCSGFTMSVYAHFGISIPRTTGGQATVGRAVSQPQAGDLICYRGHVGLYIGGGRIVHASTASNGIMVSPVGACGAYSIRRIVE